MTSGRPMTLGDTWKILGRHLETLGDTVAGCSLRRVVLSPCFVCLSVLFYVFFIISSLCFCFFLYLLRFFFSLFLIGFFFLLFSFFLRVFSLFIYYIFLSGVIFSRVLHPSFSCTWKKEEREKNE